MLNATQNAVVEHGHSSKKGESNKQHVFASWIVLNIICNQTLNDKWMYCACVYFITWLSCGMYFMNDTYLYWLPKCLGGVDIYYELHSVHSHVIHVSGYRGTFIPYMHVNLKLFLNILIFKQVMINRIVESARMLWKMGMF